jgi:hypothetical protein
MDPIGIGGLVIVDVIQQYMTILVLYPEWNDYSTPLLSWGKLIRVFIMGEF